MQKIASHLHQHTYPKFLMKHPRFIRGLYAWNGLLLQRNWVTKRELKKHLSRLPEGARVFDFGCGEGMHLLPWAGRFAHLHFRGIDRLHSHVFFGKKYVTETHLNNVEFQLAELEYFTSEKKAALATCIGVMQYIGEDEKVFKNIFNALADNGLALIYVPINGRMLLPPYRYFFHKKMHYERSQKRVRVYSEKEVLGKMERAGFYISEKKYTYGTLGILGHEMYSLLLMGMGNAGWFAFVFGLLLMVFLPVILFLKRMDFLIKKECGNGLFIVAKKNGARII